MQLDERDLPKHGSLLWGSIFFSGRGLHIWRLLMARLSCCIYQSIWLGRWLYLRLFWNHINIVTKPTVRCFFLGRAPTIFRCRYFGASVNKIRNSSHFFIFFLLARKVFTSSRYFVASFRPHLFVAFSTSVHFFFKSAWKIFVPSRHFGHQSDFFFTFIKHVCAESTNSIYLNRWTESEGNKTFFHQLYYCGIPFICFWQNTDCIFCAFILFLPLWWRPINLLICQRSRNKTSNYTFSWLFWAEESYIFSKFYFWKGSKTLPSPKALELRKSSRIVTIRLHSFYCATIPIDVAILSPHLYGLQFFKRLAMIF